MRENNLPRLQELLLYWRLRIYRYVTLCALLYVIMINHVSYMAYFGRLQFDNQLHIEFDVGCNGVVMRDKWFSDFSFL